MIKCKSGDKVVVKEWEEMEKQFPVDSDGDIFIDSFGGYFVDDMRKYCGRTVTIEDDTYAEMRILEDNGKFLWGVEMFSRKL